MQLLCDELPITSEYMPTPHKVQSSSAELPVVSTYVPAGQSMQLIVESVENWPAAQRVQVLAPMPASIFVTEPGAQSAQALLLLLPSAPAYFPGPQPMHVVC